MNEINLLSRKLQTETGIHLSRANFMAQFLVTVIEKRTVNLSELAVGMSAGIKKASAYRKLQRFFKDFALPYDLIAIMLMNFLPKGPLVVSIDRTNWQYGKKDINIFMLCANYRGIGVPILWKMLPKKGNSNIKERTELLSLFIRLFGKGRIQYLLADREFIGGHWFSFLIKEQIPFYIRIKSNTQVAYTSGKTTKAYLFFPHKGNRTKKGVKIGKKKLNLQGKYLGKGEYLIVATNVTGSNALAVYKERWQVEMCFSCLKKRGFRLEETHMSDPEKIKSLIALLALAFMWCYQVGELVDKQEPIKTKKHGRKANNLFRYGLDFIRKVVSPFNGEIKSAFRQLVLMFTDKISSMILKIIT